MEAERRLEMVKTCASPACAAPFLYWRGGKLFRFDVKVPCEPSRVVPGQICELKPSRISVFFWLCKKCCSTLTLGFNPHQGLAIVPLKRAEAHRNVIGAKARALSA
jgi:hypothetical protein